MACYVSIILVGKGEKKIPRKDFILHNILKLDTIAMTSEKCCLQQGVFMKYRCSWSVGDKKSKVLEKPSYILTLPTPQGYVMSVKCK